MPRYKMLVLSRTIEGKEDQYDDCLQNTDLIKIGATPGFVSAQNIQMALRQTT